MIAFLLYIFRILAVYHVSSEYVQLQINLLI